MRLKNLSERSKMQRNLLIFIGLLTFWCLLIFFEVKSIASGLLKPFFILSLFVSWCGFFWANAKNRIMASHANATLQRILISSIFWVVAVLLAIVIAVNLKFMLGGAL